MQPFKLRTSVGPRWIFQRTLKPGYSIQKHGCGVARLEFCSRRARWRNAVARGRFPWRDLLMSEKELAEFVAKLPEHLRFFFEVPAEGLEAEEFFKWTRERLDKVRQHREELMAHGIAADSYLAEAEP